MNQPITPASGKSLSGTLPSTTFKYWNVNCFKYLMFHKFFSVQLDTLVIHRYGNIHDAMLTAHTTVHDHRHAASRRVSTPRYILR